MHTNSRAVWNVSSHIIWKIEIFMAEFFSDSPYIYIYVYVQTYVCVHIIYASSTQEEEITDL